MTRDIYGEVYKGVTAQGKYTANYTLNHSTFLLTYSFWQESDRVCRDCFASAALLRGYDKTAGPPRGF